ncbi:hypothetical protein CSBG_03251 [Clostridium sp. 7_2_43FAA]|uniref:hypothetical protein n=1 Tax=Clostridium TaxID=1485 RepID=UPI00019B072F|nr:MULTISPECIES: hypothetical protein [Clostridium]EEH99625.1 hypothetical protein CSBG_03251 [Clostridium sp. 7_2_43FAA]
MSEIANEKPGVAKLRGRRPAPKVTPKKKEDNKMVSNNNELIEENNDIKESVDLDLFKPSESKIRNKGIAEAGVMSIVSAKTGKRVVISKEVMEKLNKPEKIVMSFAEDKIAIGEQLPNNDNYINIKVLKSKGVIYSSGIVKEITDFYKLDFGNKTSITFFDVEYIKYEDNVVAIITVS